MYTQLEQRGMAEPPVNVATLAKMKSEGQPIVCLTAYDASYAVLVDKAGVDLVLVGDSLGMVIQGHDTTVPVTVSDIIYHTRNVARGLRRAFLVSDMPFMSYVEPAQALDNAVHMMQDGGAMMIKLEGGDGQVEIVEHLAKHDIPVCAHLGLKPQSVHKIGGFKVQGREPDKAKQMIKSARKLEGAGADLLLLECVPNELGKAITEAVQVPVIGIGAGPSVDGQILVLYDILDITQGRTPRFVQNFTVGQQSPLDAIKAYVQAVKDRKYPAPEHCFS
ncbi:MAG: 3-methyl-2-oxobutanoate hydroxymethyltransferase [Proteobacteria bacterium]|jgi:3-methyl-2-oxobutanoate hydroxymethyltransferase|nr:3-methyl-2-oxobutanoate hydroxymethyltransferase [Pseudomonadota bacterium]